MRLTTETSRKTRVCLQHACREGGFTYLVLLAVVAVMGVVLAAAGEVWHTALKREKEQELLFVGDQFRRALNLYRMHTPGQCQALTRCSLEDLLKDPRAPGVQRYLRKIYADPITGSTRVGIDQGAEWRDFRGAQPVGR